MRIGLMTLPLGLFGSIVVIVLVVVFANAVGKRRHAGRTLAAGFAAVLAMGLLLLGLLALSFMGTRATRQIVHHETASQIAELRAQGEVLHAQAMVEQTRKQIEAQAADIQARVQSGTTPGDRVMVEDPTTQMSQAVELPDGVQTFEVIDENPATVQGTPEVAQTSTGVTVAGRPWTDAVEEFRDFEADVYPSIETAAEALGRNVGRDLMEHVPAAQPANTTPVYVWMQSDGDGPATRDGVLLVTRPVLEAVAEGIRQKLVNPEMVSVERPTAGRSSSGTAEDGVIVVRVHVNDVRYDNHNRWRTHTESGSGFLVADVDTADFDFSRNMRFDQKPWVADPSRFASQYPGGQWMIAYSDMSNTQQVFAHNDAIRAAAESLLPKAEAYVSHLSPGQQHLYEQKKATDPDWLRKRIADELVSRNHQTDSFTQRYDRPNYTVWREALLIDAGPGVVENITAAMVNSLNARQADQRNTWFSFIALAGLIFGTYLFLNMATKGYYAWMLRLAALGGVAAAGFLVMHLF